MLGADKMKFRSILMTMSLAFLITGCGHSLVNDQASSLPTDATETTPNTKQDITGNVEDSASDRPALVNQHDESKETFYDYSADYALIDNPEANMTYNNINEAIIKEINAKTSSLYAQAQSAFASTPNEEKEDFVTYTLQTSGESVFINTHVISYKIHFVYQSFGEHPIDENIYLNYDLNSGQVLTLDQLIDKSELEERLKEYTTDQFEITSDLDTLSFDQFYFENASQLKLLISSYVLSSNQVEELTVPLSINSDAFTSPVIGTSVKAKNLNSATDAYDISIIYPELVNTNGIYPTINQEIEADILAFQDESIQMAKQDHEEQNTNANVFLRPYQFSTDYTVYTNTNKVLSLGILYYQYTGGAHGMNWEVFHNYDIKTGQVLTLADLFEKGFDYQTYINDQIYQKLSENDPYNAFTFEGIAKDQAFYIEGNELVIYFSPYEIAPYVAGAPTFRIPLPE